MTLRLAPRSRCLAPLVLAAAAAGVHAAEPPAAVPAPLAAFAAAGDAACGQLVPPLLSRPDFKPVFAARPIAVVDVCRCVHESVVGDPRLPPVFQGDNAAVEARMKSPDVTGYLAVRVVSAALACTSREMERSLAAASVDAK